jgi:hypothetical protein
METLTRFYRMPTQAITTLRTHPQLFDWLLGYDHDPLNGERLGYRDNRRPPALDLTTSWDNILILLAGTEQHGVYIALDNASSATPYASGTIRLYSIARVQRVVTALHTLQPDVVRALALQRDLHCYQGQPINAVLDDLLAQLQQLWRFWHEAARTRYEIVACLG